MQGPFHEGEILVQQRSGEREVAMLNGRMIDNRIPAAAKPFVAQQRLCVAATLDPEGDLWAEFLTGPAGFARCAEDLASIELRRSPSLTPVKPGDTIGLLFIELIKRRRLRVNGIVASKGDDGLTIDIEEAFPNCPKYIQRRSYDDHSGPGSDPVRREGSAIDRFVSQWVGAADSLFLATGHPDGRLDASHRGGNPGFVEVRDGALMIPDYHGNSMFNSLGNIALNPRTGLAFVDFAQNRQLNLTGYAFLHFDREPDRAGGTGRWVEFRPRKWLTSPVSPAFDWTLIENSPFNP